MMLNKVIVPICIVERKQQQYSLGCDYKVWYMLFNRNIEH